MTETLAVCPVCLSPDPCEHGRPKVNVQISNEYRGQSSRTILECELEKLLLAFVRTTMTMSGRRLAELHEEARKLGIKP